MCENVTNKLITKMISHSETNKEKFFEMVEIIEYLVDSLKQEGIDLSEEGFDTDGRAYQWLTMIDLLEEARKVVLESKNDKHFESFFLRFIAMLPNSYKVVKL